MAELRHGVECDAAFKAAAGHALEQLQRFIPVLPFDQAAAVRYGAMATAARQRRRDALDRLIAAHAASLELVLVTNNEADFKGYPGLMIENWIAPLQC